jgi:hypothetical protein
MGPCHVNNGGCSPMAACFATAGSVQCFCLSGYTGTGVGPAGCMPGGGSSGGPVFPGGGGGGATPGGGGGGVVVSPCASGPCQNGGTCYPLATGFLCNCAQGYTGLMRMLITESW